MKKFLFSLLLVVMFVMPSFSSNMYIDLYGLVSQRDKIVHDKEALFAYGGGVRFAWNFWDDFNLITAGEYASKKRDYDTPPATHIEYTYMSCLGGIEYIYPIWERFKLQAAVMAGYAHNVLDDDDGKTGIGATVLYAEIGIQYDLSQNITPFLTGGGHYNIMHTDEFGKDRMSGYDFHIGIRFVLGTNKSIYD